ncbi:MAG TPA: ATP-binding protein, partial [Rhodocyclaceae bacterium]|nr:ATP-binding protein [Rhodocyclaceae bacterium]
RGAAVLDQLEPLLERLFDYAAVHFRTEEGLMRSSGLLVDYLVAHEQKHRAFVDQLVELKNEIGKDPAGETGPSLLRFLTSWLTFHILDEDQRADRQIDLIRSGETPESACAQSVQGASEDRARVALVAALNDLYSMVGERNRTLQEANEKLRLLTASLEEHNRQLEQRVDERTRELNATIERMERTRSQLLQSEKMAAIGQLAAGVAHEINNPVGFVNSNLGTMKKYVHQLFEVVDAYDAAAATLPDGDQRRQRIEQARDSADLSFLRQDMVDLLDESEQGLTRVRKIVQDLKDFSHVDESGWQDADLTAGLESTLNVVWSELKYKAEVVKHYAELPPVRCVAAQINQVFMNLLVNAAQAIDGRGTITLSTGSDADRVWVDIADTGQGMGLDVQQRIFEPFYTTKPVGKGTGLGLSISWDIVVKKHGGSLSVDSTPGQGTRFRICLPLNDRSGAAAAASTPH